MEQWRRCGHLLAVVAVALVAAMLPSSGEAKLSPDYYRSTCPDVEAIVRAVVARKVKETFVTIPATLRLFFHDCFVEGCDASVIIASRDNDAEKDAPDNLSLAGDGFDTVVRAKAEVEKKCSGVVSCADILAIAARDVVSMSSGPHWAVELGRLDGLVSKAGNVAGRLPGPDMRVKDLAAMFAKHKLTTLDMVALSGAHTVGFAHCTRFTDRLYRHGGGAAKVDPSYDPAYARQLMEACPPDVGPTIAVNMDPITPIAFDNAYYSNLAGGLGLFTSDQALYSNGASRPAVKDFAKNQTRFFEAFKDAMVKLGRLGVKTGRHGEIRRDCTAFNK
ncbi:peroxidase 73-like [Phragmites australis]|uniref:peroxidase 73-like n=1 Tax=Phragmites australis TaxID=29695 RepID=UPI002D7A318D|nr:peroxidase 73-like [Phragmites australis]